MRIGPHLDVVPLRSRPQESARRGLPPAVQDVALVVADTELGGAVVVGVARQALGGGPGHEGLADRVEPVHVRDGQLALAAAQPVVARADLALRALEVRQHFGGGPAPVARCGPLVVVRGQAAVVYKAVDGGGAAQRAPLRKGNAPAFGVGRWLAGELPGERRVEQHLDEACRNVQERVPVGRSRFQHAHGGLAVLAQAIGEDAPRSAGANDDVVEDVAAATALELSHHSSPMLLCGRRPGTRP